MGKEIMIIDNFINHIKNVDKDFSPRVILDIGSRDLGQSIEFNSVFPEAKIYAFEPNPEQFQICLQLSENYSNIGVEELAVGETDGTCEFYITIGNIGASSTLEPLDVPFGTTNAYHKVSARMTRLDSWLKENNIEQVDVLWMDTQGIELMALRGMGDHLKKVKFIHCEAAERGYYKGHILKPELEEYLKSLGFSIAFHNPAYHPYGEGDIIATNMNI
jgi:FkbM family methyltransferase